VPQDIVSYHYIGITKKSWQSRNASNCQNMIRKPNRLLYKALSGDFGEIREKKLTIEKAGLTENETLDMEEKEVNELLKIFSHEQFNKLLERFKQKNQRLGFICILTGSAGVGKTETVLQIARICQRNIVKYDATKIYSGYIGVAACKVKDIFESYNKVVKNSKTYPILFLNEADSFFSRRIDISCSFNQVSSLDENRTQTILLESLENFQGIIIATTNIISNFDHAFERRFLFKIIFDKPDRNTRVKILKTCFHSLMKMNFNILQEIIILQARKLKIFQENWT